jgi:P-type Cu2+ transporter
MPTCTHCGTPFSVSSEVEKFCCRGCEFVHDLIHHEGLDRFYDLRGRSTVRPVRSLPFESRDFGWLDELVERAESGVAPGEPAEADFSLEGMSCVGCVWLVENIFQRQAGALEISAHPATGVVQLRWAAGEANLRGLAEELASFGYALGPKRNGSGRGESRQLAARLGLCGAFAMNGMVFTLPSYVGMPPDFAFAGIFQLVTFLSATLAMLVGGSYFIKRAWYSLRAGSVHIDLPIALGLILAFCGSIVGWALGVEGLLYFDFVGTFVFLMLGGRFLQVAAMEKNRNRLQRRRPVPESVVSPDRQGPVPLGEIVPGLRYELFPGHSVPVASSLEKSAADFSLEWINGEAEPHTFVPGRPLPAGAIHLGKDPVVVAASETWNDSLLARLMTSERQAVRVPALERLLRGYLWAVLAIGLAGFGTWLAMDGLATAVQVMISVFVVSCPCALGVALPFADELAGTRMERAGVFIRENLLWSRLRTVKTIIFDKTGTLTLERPVLENIAELEALDIDARRALAQLTHGSLHPVSRSLLEALGREGQQWIRGDQMPEVHEFAGAGRFMERMGEVWSLGRPGWAPGGLVPGAVNGSVHDTELRCNGRVVGGFRFQESLRPDAVASLGSLREGGYRLVILSGDRPEKVSAAAKLLGIDSADAHAALQPDEKERMVRELDHRDTLFLGDGANDSLAFNAAWATGTPVVDRSLLEGKADFYFLGQGLRFLPLLLGLAKRRRKTVRGAFAFALLYNATAVTAALLGYMNPLVAAIIMPLSSAISLAIVGLGLREGGDPGRHSTLR